jgi:hypothetical protein
MSSLLAVSLVCNVVLLVLAVWFWFRRPGKAEGPRLDTNATELLSRLMADGAVVVTQVVDPSSIFLYSPRDNQ